MPQRRHRSRGDPRWPDWHAAHRRQRTGPGATTVNPPAGTNASIDHEAGCLLARPANQHAGRMRFDQAKQVAEFSAAHERGPRLRR